MRIAFGADHAGYEMRVALARRAQSRGIQVEEFGATGPEAYDYPDAADLVAERLRQDRADFGVLICGTGIGMDIRANRWEHIRAANCLNLEMAALSREHNHANVLCLGARLLSLDEAEAILDVFLKTPESQEPRHVRRVEKMDRAIAACETP